MCTITCPTTDSSPTHPDEAHVVADTVERQLLSLLLVENDAADVESIKRLLGPDGNPHVEMRSCASVAAAVDDLQSRSRVDVILLDVGLCEGGIDTFRSIQAVAPKTPIVILSNDRNVDLARAAVREGAQDYLVKGTFQYDTLERSLRYAVERQQLIQRDIQHEKEAAPQRDRLAAIVNSTDDAVVSVDSQGIVTSWNPGAERMLGYTAAEAVGQHVSILWPKRQQRTAEETLRRAMCGETLSGIQTRRLHKSGRSIDVLLSISPVRDAQGSVISVAGIMHDMTERTRAERAERSLRAVEEQLKLAREIHKRLLPGHDPYFPGFDIAGVCSPALAVGGDYFDYITLPDGRLVLLVADVSSHGFAPALIMTGTRRLLRSLLAATSDLSTIIRLANQAIEEDTEHHNFVTLFVAIIDPEARTLEYVGCGHSAQLIRSSNGQAEELRSLAFPLGIVGDFEPPRSILRPLDAGDILLLSTDGFHESESPDQEPFGMDRIVRLVARNSEHSAREILNKLVRTVSHFCRHALPADDRTAIIVKVK